MDVDLRTMSPVGAWRGRKTSGRRLSGVRWALTDVPEVLSALGCEVEAAAPDLTDVRETLQVARRADKIRLG